MDYSQDTQFMSTVNRQIAEHLNKERLSLAVVSPYLRKFIKVLFVLTCICCYHAKAQRNDYYVSIPKDSGYLLYLNPVEFSISNKGGYKFIVDFTINFLEKENDASATVMNFSLIGNKPLTNIDSVTIIFNNTAHSNIVMHPKKFYVDNTRKKTWESRYSCELNLKSFVIYLNNAPHARIKIYDKAKYYEALSPKKWLDIAYRFNLVLENLN